jgi:F-box protein 42
MLIFGGRTFNQREPSYPLSDATWVFNFDSKEWNEVRIEGQGPNAVKTKPTSRYGHTQVTLDDENVLVIGGCGGPNQVFADVWLLTSCPGRNFLKAKWEKIKIINTEKFTANDFHYYGCKVKEF